MNKHGLRNWGFKCLLLIFAFAQLVACTSSSDTYSTKALIVWDGSADVTENAALTNLNTLMTGVGYTVTTNIGIPAGKLSGYGQIWDIRYLEALSGTDESSYKTYLEKEGTLVLTGGYSSTTGRDASIITLITDFGGGPITLSNSSTEQAQTVEPEFASPYTVNDVNYTYGNPIVDGTTTAGRGTFITEYSSTFGSAILYARGTLSGITAGKLIVVFDTNFLNFSSNPDAADFYDLTVNMLFL